MFTDLKSSNRAWLTLLVGMLWLLILGTAARAETVGQNNPCSLLTGAEAEAVLGEVLAGPPYRSNGNEPSADGSVCRYETASFRVVTVEVDWTQGRQLFGLLGMGSDVSDAAGQKGILTLGDGVTRSGAWDEAQAFLCCQIHALSGDRQVVIDIAASKATLDQAAGLADKAVQRLDHPLQIDPSAGIEEAMANAKTRPVIASACTLVTKEEAEALIGTTLAADPEGAEGGCTYSWQADGGDYQETITMSVTWRDGFGEMRRTAAAIGKGLEMLADQGLDLTQETTSTEHFDAYLVSIIGVMAVRRDVLLSIESGPMSDIAAKFIAVAASKL